MHSRIERVTKKALIIGKRQIIPLEHQTNMQTDKYKHSNQILLRIVQCLSNSTGRTSNTSRRMGGGQEMTALLPNCWSRQVKELGWSWQDLYKLPKNTNNAYIIQNHKRGRKEDIQNYRPISLLPMVYKIFTKIVHNGIQNTLNNVYWIIHGKRD